MRDSISHNLDCPIGCGPDCQIDEYAAIGTRCGTFGAVPPAVCANCGHATLHTSDYPGCPDKIVCNWHRPDASGDGYYCHCCVYDPIECRGWDSEHWAYLCRDGRHNSFWATVTTSPEWALWEKEITRRMKFDLRPVWDIDESEACGWISAEHFTDFLAFVRSSAKHNSFSDPIPVALALVVGLPALHFGGWLPGLAGAGFGAMVGLLTRGRRR